MWWLSSVPRRNGGAMHVVTTRRHYKDRVYETHLLRRSFREGGQVRNQTLANLSHLPAETIELIRRSLRGETFVAAADAFRIDRSRPHGTSPRSGPWPAGSACQGCWGRRAASGTWRWR
jgi:hypothetical protein